MRSHSTDEAATSRRRLRSAGENDEFVEITTFVLMEIKAALVGARRHP